MRLKVVGTVILTALVCCVGTALATDFEPTLPPSPDPSAFDAQLTVSPSDGLVDGQVVSVDGKRFGFNSTGVLRQCTEDLSQCSAAETPFTSGRNGAFGPFDNPATQTDPASVPVDFVVHTSFEPAGAPGGSVSCVPSSCVLDAYADLGFQVRRACHHLTFGAVDATPCTQPTSATTSTSSVSTTVPPSSTTALSSSTTSPSSTTSTTSAPSRLSPRQCASIRAERAGFNGQLDRRQAASDPRALAALERSRASGNAKYDRLLTGCPPA